ncbi:MAG TPA: TadE/TadG family type IV pilus assembly protein [Gemmataceae bacterium]|nr:TadE/TadG family type IV pilus assembly protein [Gemmataceae bacterium]
MRVQARARRAGAAVIEFAAVVPVLLLFILGIVEYGRMLMIAQMTTSGSREGARYAVQADATPSSVDQYVRTYLSQASIPSDAVNAIAIEYQVSSSNSLYTAENQGWVTATNLSALLSGTAIRVRVEVNYSAVSWLPTGVFLPSETKLSGTTVMRKE